MAFLYGKRRYDENNKTDHIGDKISVKNDTVANTEKKIAANPPENWYDYSKSNWANIVVTDGTIEGNTIKSAKVLKSVNGKNTVVTPSVSNSVKVNQQNALIAAILAGPLQKGYRTNTEKG